MQQHPQQGNRTGGRMQASQPLAKRDGEAHRQAHHPEGMAPPGHADNTDHRTQGVAQHDVARLGQGAFGMAKQQHGAGPKGSHHQGVMTPDADRPKGRNRHHSPEPGRHHLVMGKAGLIGTALLTLRPKPSPDH